MRHRGTRKNVTKRLRIDAYTGGGGGYIRRQNDILLLLPREQSFLYDYDFFMRTRVNNNKVY